MTHQDRAASRIAPLQCPLGATKHFDCLDVDHVRERGGDVAARNTVDDDRDRRVYERSAVLCALATNVEGRCIVRNAFGFERSVRQGAADVREVLDEPDFQRFLRQRRCRNRHLLQGLRPFLSYYDDFLEATGRLFFRGLLRAGLVVARHCRGRQRRGHCQLDSGVHRLVSPFDRQTSGECSVPKLRCRIRSAKAECNHRLRQLT